MSEIKKILVFTATYNEADNIEKLVEDIFEKLPKADVLVVDDASPDGTGDILDRLSTLDSRVHVKHRHRKLGLGTAHRIAMKYAVKNAYDALVTMDADFSHNPSYLPELVSKLSDADFVTGSRYMKGGSSGYGFLRTLLSKSANHSARLLLGLRLHECTTSYRGFRISLLRKLNMDAIRSEGYSFFVESVFLISRISNSLTEFPIHFEDRRAGSSKISKKEIIKGMTTLLTLFAKRLLHFKFYKDLCLLEDEEYKYPCNNCGSVFQGLLYSARESRDGKLDADTIRCTSTGHRSHGKIVQCLECGLVFTASDTDSESITGMYSEVRDEKYAENIEARERTFKYNFSNLEDLLTESGSRLLDIGAYCGAFVKVANDSGFDAVGVEPSKWAAEYAAQKMGQKVYPGTIDDLPPELKSFDVISMWDVLEHLPDPKGELKKINKRLKRGAFLIFSTLDIENWFPRASGRHWPWFMDMHIYYFNQDIIEQLLEKSGFRLIESRKYCHIITLEYFFEKLASLGLPFMRLFKRLPFSKKIYVPFRFGDIKMFIAEKVS